MQPQTKTVPFDEFMADAPSIFEEAASGGHVTVERNGQLFRLTRVRRSSRPRKRRYLTEDDPLWDIVGIGHSEGPGDVARNKHKYIAEAIAAQWQVPLQESADVPESHDRPKPADAVAPPANDHPNTPTPTPEPGQS